MQKKRINMVQEALLRENKNKMGQINQKMAY